MPHKTLRVCGNGAGSDGVILSSVAGEGALVAPVLCDAYMGTVRRGCQRTKGGVQLTGRRGAGGRKGCRGPGVVGAGLSAQRGMGLTEASGGTQRKAARG